MVLGLASVVLTLATNIAPRRDTYACQPLDVEHYRLALTLTDSTDRRPHVLLRRLAGPSASAVARDRPHLRQSNHGDGRVGVAVPTRDALAFSSEWVGPYSYEKLANVQSNSVSGGMESASDFLFVGQRFGNPFTAVAQRSHSRGCASVVWEREPP